MYKDKEKQNECVKKYMQSEKGKATRKAYYERTKEQRAEYFREYRKDPEVLEKKRAKDKAYRQQPEVRARDNELRKKRNAEAKIDG